jgi:plastocyanin
MRRSVIIAAALLALAGSACAKAKDTGFPPPEPSSSTSTSASPSVPTTPVDAATLVAKNVAWDQSQLLFEANKKITVTVDNQDSGVPHNFGLYTDKDRTPSNEIFKPATDTQGGSKQDYVVPALKAGTYYFQCDIHPSMNGTATVK